MKRGTKQTVVSHNGIHVIILTWLTAVPGLQKQLRPQDCLFLGFYTWEVAYNIHHKA